MTKAASQLEARVLTTPRRRLDPQVRHRVMASIRKKDTKPERVFREALRQGGLRGYRLHVTGVPGTPDVAYTRWRVAVFVDGVFWHARPDYFQFGTKGPYWDGKMRRNLDRDERVNAQLEELGWLVLRFWDVDVLRDPNPAVDSVRDALRRRGRVF